MLSKNVEVNAIKYAARYIIRKREVKLMSSKRRSQGLSAQRALKEMNSMDIFSHSEHHSSDWTCLVN